MRTWAADIGGTSIKLAVLDHGSVVARDQVRVEDRLRLEPCLRPMERAWRSLDALHPGEGDEPVAIALAFAGLVDVKAARVVSTNGKFNDAPQLDLNGWAQRLTGRPLRIDNDARVACLGEWRHGAGRGCDDLVMMTFGTGIGTSAVIEGRLLRGVHGQAGILGGHLPIELDGPVCSCGNAGCVEAVASTDRLRQLVEREVARRPALRSSPLMELADLSFEVIAKAAEAGDALALRLREVAIKAWGAAAVGLIHAYDPQRLIIGGGVGRNWPAVMRGIRAHVDQHAWTPWGRVEVRQAELGDDAALIGCASLGNDEQQAEARA